MWFNNNLKEGDLCLIIGAIHRTENIGKTVTLVSLLKPGDVFAYRGLRFKHDGGAAGPRNVWVVEGEGLAVGTKELGVLDAKTTIVLEDYLMKIPPEAPQGDRLAQIRRLDDILEGREVQTKFFMLDES